ncbi:MAG: site-specific integrase [Proteobacteria bacterium]|nr:site-specific integrase [Pseudomonadota bacterium]
MARTVRNAKIDTPSARAKLAARREPRWVVISKGCAVGYRKGTKGGTWVARFRDEAGKHHYHALGAADDAREADGVSVFSFAQAQATARKWFARRARELAEGDERLGPYTVRDAIDDYVRWYAKRGRALDRLRATVDAHIVPSLGEIDASKLTTRRLERWMEELADAPARLRTGRGAEQRYREAPDDPEAKRRRRLSANRVWTVLRAALNRAFAAGRIGSDEAWRRVQPFRGVDVPKARYLSEDECRRLVNACPADLRDLVRGALFTGARYGELASLEVADFNPDAATVHIRTSKGGKARHVFLSKEGAEFFTRVTAGRRGRERLFRRAGGGPWGRSHQHQPLAEACKAAKIDPPASFHVLRHTHASHLAMRGVPMAVIAAQLGHADTRICERHYAHLSPGYVADTIRAAFPALGIHEADAVTALRRP